MRRSRHGAASLRFYRGITLNALTEHAMNSLDRPSLDAQRAEFSQRRFLAMPLAGTLAWTLIGVVGASCSLRTAVYTLYGATGAIFYLGLLIARFTGEDLLGRQRAKNSFDRLFMLCMLQAVLVFAIALPFGVQDVSSLPMSIGILAGLMWLPFSWIIQHWIGLAHTLVRTALILLAWLLFPAQRFVLIPAIVVLCYLPTMLVLERRWQASQGRRSASAAAPAAVHGAIPAARDMTKA